jgi:hypothetical protein
MAMNEPSSVLSSRNECNCLTNQDLDIVLDLLTYYEDTPFAAPPVPGPRCENYKLAAVQQKIHALAMRTFTSENTLLKNIQSGHSHPDQGVKGSKSNETEQMLGVCLLVGFNHLFGR